MPKARVKVSKLFHMKLSDTTLGIIRAEFSDWFHGYKKEMGEPNQMSMELVQDFVEQLKSKHQRFRSVNVYEMKSNQPGTNTLYEFMRKRVGKGLEEKPTSPAKIKVTPGRNKPHSQGAKPTKRETRADGVQNAQKGEQDVARVTGDHIPGYNEERDVKFYQNKQSNQSETYSEYESTPGGEQDNAPPATPAAVGGQVHQQIKQVFISLVDCHAKTNIAAVDFKWTKIGDCTLDVQAVRPFNKRSGN